jgi:hypothetical protein
MDNLQNMLSAIRLVNNVGYNLPPAIKADLQIRVFRMFKAIQEQKSDFQKNFTSILDKQIRQNLQLLEEREQEKQQQKEEKQ